MITFYSTSNLFSRYLNEMIGLIKRNIQCFENREKLYINSPARDKSIGNGFYYNNHINGILINDNNAYCVTILACNVAIKYNSTKISFYMFMETRNIK